MSEFRSRRSYRLLTSRGRSTLTLGIAVVLVSMVAGQRDVMRVGLLLIGLPVIALIMVAAARLRLSSQRSIVPQRVQLGSPIIGRITLSLESRLPIGMVMLEDQVPAELGEPPRFTIDRAGVTWRREIEYPLLGRVRGRWHCGPLTVRTQDPFGMVRRDQQFSATTEVLVTPQIVPLTPFLSSGGAGSSGESQPHRIGVVGADDVLIREYRHGDDVRRVHWRSTARRGDLMVRREEQAWDPAARIILDSRAGSHAGSGVNNSLEWAVSAAASIGLRFIEDGYRLQVYEAEGPLEFGAEAGANRTTSGDLLISRLTDLRPRRTYSLRYSLETASLDQSGELVVAVMGRLSIDDAHALLRSRRQRTQGLAILLDVDTFTGPAPTGNAGHPDRTGQHGVGDRRPVANQADAGHHTGRGTHGRLGGQGHRRADIGEAARLLAGEGWRVVQVTRGMSVGDAWARLNGSAPPRPLVGPAPGVRPTDREAV